LDKNFNRLLATLTVLQRNQRLSTSEVRNRLEVLGYSVTQRTVQRDLEELARHYPIECDDRVKPFGWRWREGAKRISLPSMGWPEAVSFHLLETYLQGVMPTFVKDSIEPYLAEARRKLAEQFEHLPLKRWPERVRVINQGSPQSPPPVPRTVHEAFTEAVLLGRRLSIRYQKLDAQAAKAYTVSPLGLVQYGSVFYAPVRFEDHEDVRTVALHRVRRAVVLDEPSGIESFDLGGWLSTGVLGFGGQETIELVLVLHDDLPERLKESPLSADQRLERTEAGLYQLESTVLDTVQLRRWLLSLGPKVEVLAPLALREEVGRLLRKAAMPYLAKASSSG